MLSDRKKRKYWCGSHWEAFATHTPTAAHHLRSFLKTCDLWIDLEAVSVSWSSLCSLRRDAPATAQRHREGRVRESQRGSEDPRLCRRLLRPSETPAVRLTGRLVKNASHQQAASVEFTSLWDSSVFLSALTVLNVLSFLRFWASVWFSVKQKNRLLPFKPAASLNFNSVRYNLPSADL